MSDWFCSHTHVPNWPAYRLIVQLQNGDPARGNLKKIEAALLSTTQTILRIRDFSNNIITVPRICRFFFSITNQMMRQGWVRAICIFQ